MAPGQSPATMVTWTWTPHLPLQADPSTALLLWCASPRGGHQQSLCICWFELSLGVVCFNVPTKPHELMEVAEFHVCDQFIAQHWGRTSLLYVTLLRSTSGQQLSAAHYCISFLEVKKQFTKFKRTILLLLWCEKFSHKSTWGKYLYKHTCCCLTMGKEK